MNQPWTEPKLHPDCREDCVSELQLDQLLHEELDPGEATEVHRAIEQCRGCEARWAERQAGLAGFPNLDVDAMVAKIHVGLAEAENLPESSAVEHERGWLTWLFGAKWIGAAAMMTLAVFVFMPGGEGPILEPKDTLRAKGGSEVVIYRNRAGVVEALSDGAEAKPGDRIQFELRGLSNGYLKIVGKEASGDFYELLELESVPADEATRYLIPQAFELDDSLGVETLYIYHCEKPLGPGTLPRGELIPGCERLVKTLTKVPQR